ncbi:hypothetical protein GCM10029976_059400 [Kribbella albertanoniae]
MSIQAVTLVSLALNSAKTGDVRLGEAIAEQASRILSEHLLRASTERSRLRAKHTRDDGGTHLGSGLSTVYPVSPVLRDVMTLLVSATSNSDDGVRKAADVVFNHCLSASGPEEQTPVIFIGRLSVADISQYRPDHLTTWLRRAGVTALRLRQREAFEMVVTRLREVARIPKFETLSVRSLSALCLAAVRLDPGQFRVAWNAISDWASTAKNPTEIVRLAMQVGAGAQESGAFTVAHTCARSIVDDGSLDVLKTLTDLDHVFSEAVTAQLMETDLGRIPTDTLERFRDYAAVL